MTFPDIHLNHELMHVNVVLAPDPNVFRHSNPLAGMEDNGIFVIQSDMTPEELWESFPAEGQATIRQKKLKVYAGGSHPHDAQKPEPLTLQ